MTHHQHPTSLAGIMGGTCLAIILHITTSAIIETILYAAIGAAVSFLVTYVLRRLLTRKKTS